MSQKIRVLQGDITKQSVDAIVNVFFVCFDAETARIYEDFLT